MGVDCAVLMLFDYGSDSEFEIVLAEDGFELLEKCLGLSDIDITLTLSSLIIPKPLTPHFLSIRIFPFFLNTN